MEPTQPWYIRYGAKILGIFTAILCFICGVTAMISISIGCIIAGVLLIIISIIVMTLEAPFCCAMVPQLNRVSEFTENRPPLQRIIFYAIAALLPICICFGISTVFAALALAGSCGFNVWRYIKTKRAPPQGTPGVVIGPGPGVTTETTYHAAAPAQPFPPSSGAYGDVGHTQGQMFEKAAVGAVRGVMSGGGGGGRYP